MIGWIVSKKNERLLNKLIEQDCAAQYYLHKTLRENFAAKGVPDADAVARTIKAVRDTYFFPMLHDPTYVKQMVDRHGPSHLEQYPENTCRLYERFWSGPSENRRYGLFRWDRTRPVEEAPWELVAEHPTLLAAKHDQADRNERCGFDERQMCSVGPMIYLELLREQSSG